MKPITDFKLWKYNRVTGFWLYQRSITSGEEISWLHVYQKYEPEEVFRIAKHKPIGKPKKEDHRKIK